ncbi:transporter substrate-binding domain-containing protein [Alteromonas sp. MMG017]|uniref:substrate-binding periplasmic protein n=1 Tax=Alteromonas sp. MMG017 TaxID=2822692 RepID=UPI001B3A26EC|nr:transporter substrate-binding domain-containing protein [Alteromonas sp. MMG017]MBQ4829210.1 transporter substrate-binding domain-containing protein [Alteromonas sp. MMG017]
MHYIVVLLIILFSSHAAFAKQIEVVVGWTKPPYVISEQDSGFELELVRAILLEMGHDMSPIYVPFGRTASLVKKGGMDIGLTLNPGHDIDPAILTDAYVYYQNVAVSRTDRNLEINEIEDLLGHSVIAFQTAISVLGEEFKNTLAHQKNYMELAQQERQVNLLLLGSVDVAVLDRNIFQYVKHQLPVEKQHDTKIHELFPVSSYSAAIRDEQLRNEFNSVLAQFIKDGRYQSLLDEFGLFNFIEELPAQPAKKLN